MLTDQQTVSNTPWECFRSQNHWNESNEARSLSSSIDRGREKVKHHTNPKFLSLSPSSSLLLQHTVPQHNNSSLSPNNAFVLHFMPLLCIPSSLSPCIPCFGAPCDIPAMWEQEPRVEWREEEKTDRFFVPTWPSWMSALLPLAVCVCCCHSRWLGFDDVRQF